LKDPNKYCFREGVVRKELNRNKIHTMDHLYRLSSEIVHGHYKGLYDVGLMEKGLFVSLPPIENQILVMAKFFYGIAGFVGLSMMLCDFKSKNQSEEIYSFVKLYDYLIKNVLVHNRFDHIWTILAEERHWVKFNEEKFIVGDAFDYMGYSTILRGFHIVDDMGKKPTLSSQYDL
jgi:hypothetical protein